MSYCYCLAENWGKDFIRCSDTRSFKIVGFPGNIWQIPTNNKYASRWVSRIAGTYKSKKEAQEIIDLSVTQLQDNYDNHTENLKTQDHYISLSEDEKTQFVTSRSNNRPRSITLPD